jgi:membrane protein DedA with SNARE-associated domain
MPWWAFLFANAAGAILWASVFGFGGYIFGELLFTVHSTYAPFLLGAAIIGFFGIGYLLHRYERQLIVYARAELPGPLDQYTRR